MKGKGKKKKKEKGKRKRNRKMMLESQEFLEIGERSVLEV